MGESGILRVIPNSPLVGAYKHKWVLALCVNSLHSRTHACARTVAHKHHTHTHIPLPPPVLFCTYIVQLRLSCAPSKPALHGTMSLPCSRSNFSALALARTYVLLIRYYEGNLCRKVSVCCKGKPALQHTTLLAEHLFLVSCMAASSTSFHLHVCRK